VHRENTLRAQRKEAASSLPFDTLAPKARRSSPAAGNFTILGNW
jgi:hypothetical protein